MSHEQFIMLGHTVAITGQSPKGLMLEIQAMQELRRSHASMLKVLERLEESSTYWSEYDVPIGIVQDIKDAIKQARKAS